MRNVIKNPLFTFAVGAIIFGSIGSVVAYNYNAKDVSYTPSDNTWNVNNVDAALKDLKQISKENKIDVNEIKSYTNVSQGNRIPNRNTSLTLEPGKYFIYGNTSSSTTWDSSNYVDYETSPSINIACSKISILRYLANSSNATTTGKKMYNDNNSGVWYCDIKSRTTVTITNPDNCCNENFSTSTASIQAIKISN